MKERAADRLYGGVYLWTHQDTSNANSEEGHGSVCLTTQSNTANWWRLWSIADSSNQQKLWCECGVDLGKQKVISFSGKFISGISKGCKIDFRKSHQQQLQMDYSNFLHFYYSLQQARVFNNVFLYSKKRDAKFKLEARFSKRKPRVDAFL